MHNPDNHQRIYKSGSTIVAQELTRNNMEIAGLVVYFFALAMVFTLFAILMLFGSGAAAPQASMNWNQGLRANLHASHNPLRICDLS